MNKKKSLLIVLVVILAKLAVGAVDVPDMGYFLQDINNFVNIGNRYVSAMVQDQYGFVWIGTQNGLYRYDGTTTTRFEHVPFDPNSLASNQIQTLHFQDGILYVGTYGGLDMIRTSDLSFRHSKLGEGSNQRLVDPVVVKVLLDRDGGLWIGTIGGLNYLAPQGEAYELYGTDQEFGGLKGKVVRGLAQAQDGTIYAGTDQGLFSSDPEERAFLPVPLADDRGQTIDMVSVMFIVPMDDGSIIAGDWDGTLVRYWADESITQLTQLPRGNLYTALKSSNGLLNIGTWGRGLLVGDVSGQEDLGQISFEYYSTDNTGTSNLLSDFVYSLMEDEQGQVWLGYRGDGIGIRNSQLEGLSRFIHSEEGTDVPWHQRYERVLSVDETSRGILVGTYGDGLIVLSENSQGIEVERELLPGEIVRAIMEQSNGDIWIGGNGGLYHWVADAPEPEQILEDTVYSLEEDPLGRLIIGTYFEGVWFYDTSEARSVIELKADYGSDRLSSNLIQDLLYHDEVLYIATNYGLNRLRYRGAELDIFLYDPNNIDGISSDSTKTLMVDGDGWLWVGSSDGGVSYTTEPNAEDPVFVTIGRADGLPSLSLTGIVEDHSGFIWLSGPNMLARYDKGTGEIIDGSALIPIIGNEVTSKISLWKTGDLLLGTDQGIWTISTSSFDQWEYSHESRVILTAIDGNGALIHNQDSAVQRVQLPFPPNDLRIQISEINYNFFGSPEIVTYIRGVDQPWLNELRGRQVSLNNLPTGHYELYHRVPDGQDQLLATVEVQTNPAFSWWAITLYVILTMGLFYGFYRLRIGMIMASKVKELEQTKKELETVNGKLSYLSTHDSLTGIPNRRYFERIYQREFQRALRDGSVLSLLVIDIDYFKLFNDTYGHVAGDDALTKVARALESYVKRPGDIAARMGGEEFMILLPGTDAEGSYSVAEGMRKEIENLGIEHSSSRIAQHLSISVGGATLRPTHTMVNNQLLLEADRCLYRAKEEGRNRAIVIEIPKDHSSSS